MGLGEGPNSFAWTHVVLVTALSPEKCERISPSLPREAGHS